MNLSKISIERPVLATVMSLVIVLFGIISFTQLPVREYPDIDPPVVSVVTLYRGASASVVETEITDVLEEQFARVVEVHVRLRGAIYHQLKAARGEAIGFDDGRVPAQFQCD